MCHLPHTHLGTVTLSYHASIYIHTHLPPHCLGGVSHERLTRGGLPPPTSCTSYPTPRPLPVDPSLDGLYTVLQDTFDLGCGCPDWPPPPPACLCDHSPGPAPPLPLPASPFCAYSLVSHPHHTPHHAITHPPICLPTPTLPHTPPPHPCRPTHTPLSHPTPLPHHPAAHPPPTYPAFRLPATDPYRACSGYARQRLALISYPVPLLAPLVLRWFHLFLQHGAAILRPFPTISPPCVYGCRMNVMFYGCWCILNLSMLRSSDGNGFVSDLLPCLPVLPGAHSASENWPRAYNTGLLPATANLLRCQRLTGLIQPVLARPLKPTPSPNVTLGVAGHNYKHVVAPRTTIFSRVVSRGSLDGERIGSAATTYTTTVIRTSAGL